MGLAHVNSLVHEVSMGKHHIFINDIPPTGQHIAVDNQEVWSKPLDEFHMQCRIVDNISAELDLIPMPGGLMVRGKIEGNIEVPCNRCAEPMQISLDSQIERFESAPDTALGYDDDMDDDFDSEDLGHIRIENAVPILDVAGLCWEEFMLAFPLRPICMTDCQGLCGVCGTNLNENTCLCKQDNGDARLAILRTIKIKGEK